MTLPPFRSGDRLDVLVNVRHLTGPHTGIEIYMETLLAALARGGRLRITALSWSPVGLDLPGVREVIPVRRPSLPGGSLQAAVWKLWFDQWGCLRHIPRKQAILYHGMDGFLPYAVRPGDRCVITVHDLGWQAYPELYNRRVRTMYRALFPWAVRRADRFIAVSRCTADDLVRRAGVPASRIEVIHHGVDPAFLAPSAAPAHSDEPPYMLAVGGVSPRKNARRLIEAFTRWRERGGHRSAYRLLITGNSLDPEFAGGTGALPAHVSLLGYVDQARLRSLYAGAAAFLYPSIYEGFGLPILEAMACGTPVVTSTTGAAPEIAGPAAALVDPFDVTSITEGIERATDPGEAQQLQALGRERVKRFDWNAAAVATESVYRQLS